MEIYGNSVTELFCKLVGQFKYGKNIEREDSRNGKVFVVNEPVTVKFLNPTNRVLINDTRDANPFFHLYEALWMLAGRNDVAPLSYYNSKIKDFSDDGKTFNGAYGYRWRQAQTNQQDPSGQWGRLDEWPDTLKIDQLDIIVDHFKCMPESRRAVLSMWNVEDDLLKIGSDLDFMQGKQSRDVACNLDVMFQIRNRELNMTVTNRSNDAIWGLMGANCVHFSILQEYMAARIGVKVGTYYHFSNNVHTYEWNWKPNEWLEDRAMNGFCQSSMFTNYEAYPLVFVPTQFQAELSKFVEYNSDGEYLNDTIEWREPFFDNVAQPMMDLFHAYKAKDYVLCKDMISRDDFIRDALWRKAGYMWIEKRLEKRGEL